MTADRLVYLVGPPGVGKSSALAAATADWTALPNPYPTAVPTVALVEQHTGRIVALEMGRRRERFSGTDALSMSIAPVACRWIARHPHPLILGEGMRLGIRSFFMAALAADYSVTLISLRAPAGVLAARCVERGSDQSLAWRMGAGTKAQRITDWACSHMSVLQLDSTRPLQSVADEIHSVLAA